MNWLINLLIAPFPRSKERSVIVEYGEWDISHDYANEGLREGWLVYIGNYVDQNGYIVHRYVHD
jgi:hypothetical protein